MKIGDTVRIKVGDNPMLNGKKFTIKLYSATTGMYSGRVEGYKYMKHQKYHWFHPHELFELTDPHDDMWPEQPVEHTETKTSLDKQLQSAIWDNFESYPTGHFEAETAIKEIKQAFIDDGWVNIREKHDEAGKIQEIQGLDGTWNMDSYNHGLYNGMEMIASIYKGGEPHFRSGEYTLQQRPQVFNVINEEVKMIGEHWYDSFIAEFNANPGTPMPRRAAIKAAKRAAGIE